MGMDFKKKYLKYKKKYLNAKQYYNLFKGGKVNLDYEPSFKEVEHKSSNESDCTPCIKKDDCKLKTEYLTEDAKIRGAVINYIMRYGASCSPDISKTSELVKITNARMKKRSENKEVIRRVARGQPDEYIEIDEDWYDDISLMKDLKSNCEDDLQITEAEDFFKLPAFTAYLINLERNDNNCDEIKT